MTEATPADGLVGEWVHSHEEDEQGRLVFRRRGYDFPPSRGRRAFELAAGGDVREAAPGPDDRTRRATGTWDASDDRLTLRVEGRAPEQFAIESVEPDRLVLRH
jgi:hypothetical protein